MADSTPSTRAGADHDRTLYVVATVHLDTQWRWTIQDTIRDFLPATMEQNFSLLENHSFFVMSFEGAFRYMLMKEYFPLEYERLKGLVERGRWRLAGSMLDAPDVNVVSPESLVRHILYGNGFFAREFGRQSCDLFLPDCFGFGFALPSIAAHCRLRGFSAQKFGNWMAPATIPFDIGRWEGPDGSSIVAAIRPEGYGEGLQEDLSQAARWIERLDETGRQCGAYVGLMYVGVGDRGGGLDATSMEWLQRSVEGRGPIQVRVDGSDQLFRDLQRDQIEKLPKHRGELLLPTHGTGCLTSQAALKHWNRRNELMAEAAEKAAVIADWLGALPYPAERLRDAWQRFLWHQMHDDLTGTSIPAAYRFSWNDELLALNQFTSVLNQSMGAIAAGLDTRTEGLPLVVFNPLSVERQDVVEARLPWSGAPPAALGVRAADGEEHVAQITGNSDEELVVAFLARVPPLSVQVFEILEGEAGGTSANDLRGTESGLENEFYKAEIDANGDLASLFVKTLDRELLSAPSGLELLHDRSARWPAWEVLFEDVSSRATQRVSAPVSARIIETGPVRCSLEVRRQTAGSLFTQRFSLTGGDSGKRLEVLNEVNWRTRGRLLKAVFPVTTPCPEATYDLGLGVIERGNNRRERYEVPAQQWADLSSAEAGCGLSVLNDSKYGWDKPDDSTLRLSLLRSPRVIRKFRHQGYQDLGHHRFTYALYGHAGDWSEADTVWQAARLNQPLIAFCTQPHSGPLGRGLTFLETDDRGVNVRSMKREEAGQRTVIRLQETSGARHDSVQLAFPTEVRSAMEVDGCEEDLGPARLHEGRVLTAIEPFQPTAVALEIAPPNTTLAPPRCEPVHLPWNLVATSAQNQPTGPGLDRRGHSIPAELFPQVLFSGGIEFRLGPAMSGSLNALVCRGQTIQLPSGNFNRIHLLAASVGGIQDHTLLLGRKESRVRFHGYSGWLESWLESTSWPFHLPTLEAGSVRPQAPPVAWYATHRHDSHGSDEPYVFCYLYHHGLDLELEHLTIELPEAEDVLIFALTLAKEAISDTRSAAVEPT
ncbi:MAG: glycoside hydrolase family 38 C-terminal domain-containing protein [Thermoanaerobaculia bacterium]